MCFRVQSQLNKILILQTAFIGDAILATPLAEAVHRLFAPCEVHFLAIPAVANVLELNPNIQRVVKFDKRGEQRGLVGLWQLSRELRREKYDLALVPHRSLRSALLVRLAGISQRIGFDRSTGAFLFTHKVAYQEKHEVERNLDLLRPIGEVPPRLRPRVFWNSADVQRVDQLAGRARIDRRCIAIAPGSVWATKRWLPDRFAALAKTLIAEMDAAVFLIGGREDRELCNRIESSTGEDCINTAGELSLRQSAALLDRCEVLITNDSAPAHLAAATRCQVVTIFGPTVPGFGFSPFGEGHAVIEKDLPCRPCGRHGPQICPLGTHECMVNIETGEVVAKVKSLLKAKLEPVH